MPRVAVVLVNWNGWRDTLACLDSLLDVQGPPFVTVVVDNASSDDSIERLQHYAKTGGARQAPIPLTVLSQREATDDPPSAAVAKGAFPQHLVLIRSDSNLGFAEGNNVALRWLLKWGGLEYILLLNNDTTVAPDFLEALIAAADSDPTIGFVGAKVYWHNNPSQIQFAGGGEINLVKGTAPCIGWDEPDRGQRDADADIGYVGGSCLLARVEMVKKIGLLDRQYFMYWEEVDWCYRGWQAGFRSRYVHLARIWHKGGASSGHAFATYWITKNSFLFAKKHGSRMQRVGFHVAYFAHRFWERLMSQLLYYKSWKGAMAVLRGTFDGLMVRPALRP